MTEFKAGQKVRVKAFDATVEGYHGGTGTTHVVDDSGYNHYVYEFKLETVLPYEDGQLYVDADGDRFVFYATGGPSGPGWQYAGNGSGKSTGTIRDLSYARRPLRKLDLGPEIAE